MNKFHLFLIFILCATISCNNKEQSAEETSEIAQENVATGKQASQLGTFDLGDIPVTTEDAGEFPHFAPPESYEYTEEKTKSYEEKLFFVQDSLVYNVGGKYYHAQLVAKESAPFEETYVVNNYKKAIERVGGVEIFSGPLNLTYNSVLKENLPYLKDLYDPFAYNYKQFIIRTPEENVWIELIHGLNAHMIDFTVVKEEAIKETIGIIHKTE